MLSFRPAPIVAPGQPITSHDLLGLAGAINDRLRSGIAEPWRIQFYMAALFRQVRNSDGGWQFPSNLEFSEFYANLAADNASWPVAYPGLPEGANVANPLMAFIFGSEAANLESESDRLGEIPLPSMAGNRPPLTPSEFWNLRKSQVGAYDPKTGSLASPVLSAGLSFIYTQPGGYSPHGNSWGGYFPTPEVGFLCDESTDINYIYRFTSLIAGIPDVEFDGSCAPTEGNPYATHVARILYAFTSYVIQLNDGTLVVLPRSQYREGPYSGEPVLRKSTGNHMLRVLNRFVADFRGSTSQRTAPGYELESAFDFQEFFTRQYLLAPQIGKQEGEYIVPSYGKFTFRCTAGTMSIASGSLAWTELGKQYHKFTTGFKCTQLLITHKGLSTASTAPAPTLVLRNGTNEITRFAIDVAQSDSLVFPADFTPGFISFELDGAAYFTSSAGTIIIEFTECLDYKPQLWDAYVLLRVGAANAGGGVDGSGVNETRADEIYSNYTSTGCVTNLIGNEGIDVHTAEVNSDAIFEAARQLSRFTRVVPRSQFIGYALEDGKSVCWFKRYAMGMSTTSPCDSFEGIAPSRVAIASGSILPGYLYIVRTAPIIYDSKLYPVDAQFSGVYGVTDYSGTGVAWEQDGIRHTAGEAGWTNEWLMGAQFKAYHWSESSMWKPNSFADHWGFNNRCHFFSSEIASDYTWLRQASYGNRITSPLGVLVAETPSSMNYAPLSSGVGVGWINRMDCVEGDTDCEEWRRNMFNACRVYESDPEIESCVMDATTGQDVVKVTFTSRFHHDQNAPESIAQDVDTWDAEALAAEGSLTMEGAVRQYLLFINKGVHCQRGGYMTGQAGNNAALSTVQTMSDNPFGTCFPHFFFTKLIPVPYVHDTHDYSESKTLCTVDEFIHMELVIRSVCEGFIDGVTTSADNCSYTSGKLYNFTYPELCYQAFGGQSISFAPSAVDTLLDAADVRPDKPLGCGPLPNTFIAAETFNQFSQATNLLTRIPVYMPMSLQVCQASSIATATISATDCVSAAASCENGDLDVYVQTTPPYPRDPDFTGAIWYDYTAFAPQAALATSLGLPCDGASYTVTTNRTDARYRWLPEIPDSELSIPEEWRDMLDTNSSFLANVLTSNLIIKRHPITIEYPCGELETIETQTNSLCVVLEADHAAPPASNSCLAYGTGYTISPSTYISITPLITTFCMITFPLVDV